jgi:hypothetical protein
MTNHVRVAAATLVAAGIALLASACGGGSPASSAEPARSPSAVAYSACIRSHGVPNFPDPDPSNPVAVMKADPQRLGVGSTALAAAQAACQYLIPATGSTTEQQDETRCAVSGSCSQAVVQKWMSGLRALAQCLRRHGEPRWPDPVVGPRGTPHFNDEQAGIDHHSQHVLDEVQQCMNITGFQGLPLP